MNFRAYLLRNVAVCGVFLAGLCAVVACAQQPVTGVVTNRTNNRPAAGDDVVLLKLAQGMQELSRTRTDSKGRFTLQVPEDGLHLVRVTHDKANYFHPLQPGTQSIEMDVYTAAAEVEGVSLDADVIRLQTEPGGGGLKVVEHFFVKNDSSPAKTLFSEHPFEFYLPPGAVVEGAAAKSPGGMAVQAAPVPESEANKYTVIFPIRPGESEFQISYRLPYKDTLTFEPRPVMPTDALAIMMPKSMTFKPGTGTPYSPVTEELGAQTYVARSVKPSQPLGFTIAGTGELPRDAAAGTQSDPGAGSQAASSGLSADPNTDTRPGGGLGVPVDKDAQRDPWTKYRWWIIGGLGLVLAAAAGFMMKAPASPATRPGGAALSPAGSALQVLRDEMFSVETDRLEGRLSDAQYGELKAAFDVVLRRALARGGQSAQTPRVASE